MQLALYCLKRLVSAIPILFFVLVCTFFLVRVLPGDPAAFYASGPQSTPEQVEQIRKELGLDRPLLEQFVTYLGEVRRGKLGVSLTTGHSVTQDLREKMPASVELTLVALVMALAVSIPLGIISAVFAGRKIDHLLRLFATLGVSTPIFVVGILLVFVFFVKLGWAPEPVDRIDMFVGQPPTITGFLILDSLLDGNWAALWSAAGRLMLPSATMALFVLAPIMRMTRASMIAALNSDFMRTAKAAGLKWSTLYLTYAFANAFIPVLTTIGIVLSVLLGANVLVERVFAWPGIGSYALGALLSSDYAPVQGFILMMALIFIVVNIGIDILYALADPRMNHH